MSLILIDEVLFFMNVSIGNGSSGWESFKNGCKSLQTDLLFYMFYLNLIFCLISDLMFTKYKCD